MSIIRVGSDDFMEFRDQGGYFVDKSPLIRAVVEGSRVLLLPRPRRFGKSLNLSMLRYFFEKSSEDRTHLFDNLEVAKHPETMAHLGTYPTIHVSLKNVKGRTWDEARSQLMRLMVHLFLSHREIEEGLDEYDGECFRQICTGRADDAALKASLGDLISHLFHHHGKPVVVLIDEYDSPVIEAWQRGYYDDMIDFMRAWLGAGLKHTEGRALYRGVVTGILRIARESIFSELNNLMVHSVLSPGPFADKFGFTEAEVEKLLADLGLPDALRDIQEWYNGYSFGGVTIYNPWSVMGYLHNRPAPPGPIWLNTSSNALVHRELARGGLPLKQDLEKLLAGEELRLPLEETTIFQDLGKSSPIIWSFLCFSGYLRAEDPRPNPLKHTELLYRLSIPNLEVSVVYEKFVTRWHEELDFKATDQLLRSLIGDDLTAFEHHLSELVRNLVSCHDPAKQPEAVYHAFVLGLLANLRSVYHIRSNPESGYGRADIIVQPKTDDYPLAFVIELKSVAPDADLEGAVTEAFEQIDGRHYAAQLEEAGVAAENIRKLAIIVQGKRVTVRRAKG